jgi:NAD-dependent dihydropyrimidine dehydrogenase PreA subunit
LKRAAPALRCAALLAVVLAAVPLRAQQPPAASGNQTTTAGASRANTTGPGSSASPGPEAAPGADPWAALGLPPAGAAGPGASAGSDAWNFDDEVKAETWGDILRPQALDLAITSAFFAFALVSFFKKSKPLKYAALAMSVAYLGITKSTLISVTDIFRFVHLDFPQFKYSLAWYLIAGFTVVTTVVWGRLYCGRICAFGAFTQLLDAVVPKKIRWEPSAKVERYAGYTKYGLLVAVVAYYAFTDQFTVYRYVEPFWMYTRQGTVLLWSMLAALLLATLVVRNLYCRFLCPVGAMLGIVSQATTLLRIKRWSECRTCKICERTCEWGAIRGPQIVRSECVRCDDCERLYEDEKKCVHWIVLRRKSEKLAAAAQRALTDATA